MMHLVSAGTEGSRLPSKHGGPRLGPSRGLLAIVLAVLCSSTPAAADSETLYRQALEATAAEDWLLAARRLREAIGEEPRARNRLSGGEIAGETAYLPHYYLGLALYRMGDCLRAPQHWRESERQGVVRQSPRYGELTTMRAECEGRFRDSASKNARLALARSEEYLALLTEQANDESLAALWTRNPGWSQTLGQQRELHAKLERELAPLSRDGEPAAVAELESRSAEQLRELKDLIDEVLAEADRAVENAVARSQPREPDGGLGAERDGSLTSAIRAYFRADYPETLRLLELETRSQGWQQAQGSLFEAAAHFALFRSSGGVETTRLEAAARAAAACIGSDETLTPDSELFSPAFRSFFEDQRAASLSDE